MNAEWARWIKTSLYKHFDANKGSLTLYLEGAVRPLELTTDRLELRTDGPDFIMVTSIQYECWVDINLLVQTRKTEYLYQHDTNIGVGQAAFSANIPIYKIGDGGTLLGCMTLDSSVETTNFLSAKVADEIVQSTIEATYYMCLQTEG